MSGEREEPARPRARRVVDRADYEPGHRPDASVRCEMCGRTMEYTASCKLTCRGCGYTRDCSDP